MLVTDVTVRDTMFGILTSGIVNIFGGVPRLEYPIHRPLHRHTRLDPGNLAPKLEYERGQSPASIGFKEQPRARTRQEVLYLYPLRDQEP